MSLLHRLKKLSEIQTGILFSLSGFCHITDYLLKPMEEEKNLQAENRVVLMMAANFPTRTVETGSPLHIQAVLERYKGKMKY